jgi:hypothetical protein
MIMTIQLTLTQISYSLFHSYPIKLLCNVLHCTVNKFGLKVLFLYQDCQVSRISVFKTRIETVNYKKKIRGVENHNTHFISLLVYPLSL